MIIQKRVSAGAGLPTRECYGDVQLTTHIAHGNCPGSKRFLMHSMAIMLWVCVAPSIGSTAVTHHVGCLQWDLSVCTSGAILANRNMQRGWPYVFGDKFSLNTTSAKFMTYPACFKAGLEFSESNAKTWIFASLLHTHGCRAGLLQSAVASIDSGSMLGRLFQVYPTDACQWFSQMPTPATGCIEMRAGQSFPSSPLQLAHAHVSLKTAAAHHSGECWRNSFCALLILFVHQDILILETLRVSSRASTISFCHKVCKAKWCLQGCYTQWALGCSASMDLARGTTCQLMWFFGMHLLSRDRQGTEVANFTGTNRPWLMACYEVTCVASWWMQLRAIVLNWTSPSTHILTVISCPLRQMYIGKPFQLQFTRRRMICISAKSLHNNAGLLTHRRPCRLMLKLVKLLLRFLKVWFLCRTASTRINSLLNFCFNGEQPASSIARGLQQTGCSNETLAKSWQIALWSSITLIMLETMLMFGEWVAFCLASAWVQNVVDMIDHLGPVLKHENGFVSWPSQATREDVLGMKLIGKLLSMKHSPVRGSLCDRLQLPDRWRQKIFVMCCLCFVFTGCAKLFPTGLYQGRSGDSLPVPTSTTSNDAWGSAMIRVLMCISFVNVYMVCLSQFVCMILCLFTGTSAKRFKSINKTVSLDARDFVASTPLNHWEKYTFDLCGIGASGDVRDTGQRGTSSTSPELLQSCSVELSKLACAGQVKVTVILSTMPRMLSQVWLVLYAMLRSRRRANLRTSTFSQSSHYAVLGF